MKIVSIIAVAAILIIGGYYLLGDRESDLATASPSPSPSSATLPVQSASASPAASGAVSPANHTITYTNAGFAPATLTIKQGDTVTFRNNSTRQMWPASAQHPTHGVYPEAGGCIGSKFDACQAVAVGGQWSFTFNQKGSWNYHDHLNATFFGKIVVN